MTASMPIIILSNVIVDEIQLATGERCPIAVGGAAVYAAVAASLWWKDVGIVAGVGEDFHLVAGRQLAAYEMRNEGLLIRDAHTIQNRLVYLSEDERTETPIYGPEHFARMQVTVDQVPASLLPAVGTYMFRDLWPDFWTAFQRLRSDLGVTLWEIEGEAAQAHHWPDVKALLPQVDIFSINLAEAQRLTSKSDPLDMARQLAAAGARVVALRMGGAGALICDSQEVLHVRPPPSEVVDVTGGGNSFSGGFLAGWCKRPGDLHHAGRCAAASAAVTLAQQGLPPLSARHRLVRLSSSTTIESLWHR